MLFLLLFLASTFLLISSVLGLIFPKPLRKVLQRRSTEKPRASVKSVHKSLSIILEDNNFTSVVVNKTLRDAKLPLKGNVSIQIQDHGKDSYEGKELLKARASYSLLETMVGEIFRTCINNDFLDILSALVSVPDFMTLKGEAENLLVELVKFLINLPDKELIEKEEVIYRSKNGSTEVDRPFESDNSISKEVKTDITEEIEDGEENVLLNIDLPKSLLFKNVVVGTAFVEYDCDIVECDITFQLNLEQKNKTRAVVPNESIAIVSKSQEVTQKMTNVKNFMIMSTVTVFVHYLTHEVYAEVVHEFFFN